MIARAAGNERKESSFQDLVEELDTLADLEGIELETAAQRGLEDERVDDEILRATEDLETDEG